jgi:dTDP-4-dehydrorhamnose 3,5-epimerase
MPNLCIKDELLPGVYLLECHSTFDSRGSFTKLFHSQALEDQGIGFMPAESFLTKSAAGVLRGMHFQVGQAAHEKLVFCPKGSVLDVVVDVRPGSAYFNKPVCVKLDEASGIALLIGKGYAHGFLSLANDSWMMYYTSTMHCPELDKGVLWSSINFNWPLKEPIVSKRDSLHPSISSWQ